MANEWKKQDDLEVFGLKLKLRDPVELGNIEDSLVWVFFTPPPAPQLHCSCLEGAAGAVKCLASTQFCMAADERVTPVSLLANT